MVSCEKHNIKVNVNSFMGSDINIPTNMLFFEGEKDMNIHNKISKMIIWYDSTECSQCKLHNVDDYLKFESEINDTIKKMDIAIVFSPDIATIKMKLFVSQITHLHYYPIYVDTANAFYKLNPHIPENKLMHTFLLDATNKVVLVGSPTQNRAMSDLYKKTIEEMVN